jgi:L-ascorbate metabolism protein UlaG (beta-lactamase superfamily)
MGHATVLLEGPSSKIAVDPWRWRDEDLKVDLVLVTHGHADHCSLDDVELASHGRTLVAGPRSVAERLAKPLGARFRLVEEGAAFDAAGASVRVLPGEGPPRAVGFHPRGDGVADLVDLGGAKHHFLGDSIALREHAGLAPDVLYVAIGGLAAPDPTEAADAAAAIKPALVVPVHWGDLNGRFDLAAQFATLCAARGVRAESKPTAKE